MLHSRLKDRSQLPQKDFGVIQKYVHSKLQIFDLLPLVHPCSFYMLDAHEFLNEKLRSEKREKNFFFCKLIYTITTIKIFTCSYVKSLKKCLRLFNKTFNNYQATYQKELCLLFETSGNFFHRVSIEIGLGLTPLLPLFVFICNKSFIKKGSFEEMNRVNDNASAFMHLNIKENK